MPLTVNGFQRMTYDDFVAEMQQQAQELFGSDIDLSDGSPMGQWINLLAYSRAEEDELSEAVYLSAYYDAAEGISLDYVAKNIGLTRIQAVNANGQVTLTVDPGTTIPSGLIIATVDGVEFTTNQDYTDTGNTGVITATVTATIPGASGNAKANTITQVITPIVGLTSVTNVADLTNGSDAETDSEFRSRYESEIAKLASSTADGIKSNISAVDGVRAAIVIENDTNTNDSSGRPPNSFEAVVLGGDDTDIANAILNSKPAGIRAFGGVSVSVNDSSGNPQSIGFSHATEVPIYIKVTLTKNSSFPADGNQQIATAIVGYIGGLDYDGTEYSGLTMGDSVISFKVKKAIGSVACSDGIDDVSITMSTDNATFTDSNITIDWKSVAQTSYDKVVFV